MIVRRSSALILGLALLLSGLVGVAGHEHASEALRAATSCFGHHAKEQHSDQQHVVAVQPTPSGQPRMVAGQPRIEVPGEEHEHRCLACHLSRARGAEMPSVSPTPVPRPLGGVTESDRAATGVLLALAHGARGPPSALPS